MVAVLLRMGGVSASQWRWREAVGMVVIFVGVAMVKRAGASVPASKVGTVEKLGAQSAAESGQYGE